MVSLVVFALLAEGGAMLMPSARAAVGDAVARLTPTVQMPFADTAQRAAAAMYAGRALWRALLEPLAAYAFAIIALMCLACATFGTVLNRVAFGRT